MWKLIKANVIATRSTLSWLAVLFGMMFTAAFLMDGMFVVPNLYFAWVAAAIFLQTDDRYKADILFRSLPVKRKVFIMSRYVLVAVAFTATTLFSLLIIYIIKLFPPEGLPLPSPLISINQVIATIIPLVIIFSACLPFYCLYGYTKGLLLGSGIIAGLMLIVSHVLDYIVSSKVGPEAFNSPPFKADIPRGIDLFLSGFLRGYIYFGAQTFLIVLSIITILTLIASVMASFKFFERKEF
jgi:hypothetical protein